MGTQKFISIITDRTNNQLSIQLIIPDKSTYVGIYNCYKMQAAKVEAKSNLNYLQVLWDPVMDLYDVKSPNDVLTKLPDIFVKFIFIFEESQYYNKW